MTHRTSHRGDSSANLGPALEICERRKWLALFVFGIVLCGIVSLTLSLPDLYRATATVLVERQQVSEAFVRPSVTAELETRLQTIREQIMSRVRLTDLIVRFNLYRDMRAERPIHEVVDRMRRDIRLEPRGIDSQSSGRMVAFGISYSGREPQTVADVTNALAELYVEGNTKNREGQAVRTAEFLRGQLADVQKELDEQERSTSAFKLSHMGELPQQIDANLASLERLNTQLRLNGENQIRAIDRRERLEKQLADTQLADSRAPRSPTSEVTADEADLTKLRQQLNELRSHFTEAYPDVVRLRDKIASLERDLREERSATVPSPPLPDVTPRLQQAITDVDQELRTLKDEEAALRRAIVAYEQRVDNVPKRQEEYQTLSRDVGATKERYDSLLKRYEEAQLAESLEQGKQTEQFRILDPAVPPRDPAAPLRLRLIVLGIIVAIGLAAGAVIAAEKFNTAFHDIDDVRAFVSTAIVVRVPLISTAADTRRARWRFALAAAAGIVAVALVAGASHYIASGNELIVRLIQRGDV